jgi:hypothetical protein
MERSMDLVLNIQHQEDLMFEVLGKTTPALEAAKSITF